MPHPLTRWLRIPQIAGVRSNDGFSTIPDSVRRLGLLLGLLAVASFSAQPSYGISWTTIDYPGNFHTQLHGVSGETVLGSWYDFPNNTSGQFTYEGGSFAPVILAFPGSDTTIAWALDGNNVVGWHFPSLSSPTVGFRYDGTGYTTISPPGATESLAYGVDGGRVVGFFADAAGGHGFSFDGTSYTTLDFPGADLTSAAAVSGQLIVGDYTVSGQRRGFTYDGTTWTSLDLPGNVSVRPIGVSGNRVVVQSYDFDTFAFRSFLYEGGVWTPLEFPGSVSTEVWSIDGDRIVGDYGDASAGQVRGFSAVIPEPGALGLLGVGLVFLPLVVACRLWPAFVDSVTS